MSPIINDGPAGFQISLTTQADPWSPEVSIHFGFYYKCPMPVQSHSVFGFLTTLVGKSRFRGVCRESEFPPTIAVSSQQSAVSKSRESEFPPTIAVSRQQSAVSKSRESEFPPTIAVSSQQSAVSKSRESEFPPTIAVSRQQSAVSKSRESEFPPTEVCRESEFSCILGKYLLEYSAV